MSRSAVFVLLCIVLAFAGSLIVSRTTFERLPHLEDEFAYLYQARIFARGEVFVSTPLPIRAYWQPFLLDVNNHRFGKYPPGWPLLLALGAHFDAPWIVNAWLAMLTVALVYRLGREIFDPATGAVAALLTAASPGGLLLSGTLMSHTSALFFTTLFLYALWRVEKKDSPQRAQRTQRKEKTVFLRFFSVISVSSVVKKLLWGGIAGIALGMVVINRPWTAVGIAAPLIVYSAGRVAWIALRRSWREGWRALRPLIVLAAAASLVGTLWPAFNYTVSAPPGESFPHYLWRFLRGDRDTDLYLYIWTYDRPGFGPGHGKIPHTLALGWRHTQRDLTCAARDLFGWALPAQAGVTVAQNACLATSPGYSWVVLPLGLIAGRRRRWTWLLLAVPVSLTAAYVAYWAGGQLYSARYLSESLTSVTVIGAAGVTGLARLGAGFSRGRFAPRQGAASVPTGPLLCALIYAALAAFTVYALAIYTPARLRPLRGYGNVNQAQIDEVNRLRRTPDRKLVVIAWGDQPWRDMASLMAVTDPHLDSDIVLARDPDQTRLRVLLSRWQNREVMYFVDGKFTATLAP